MTELKLNARPEPPTRTPGTSRRTYVTGVFAGLLMVTIILGIIGASRSKDEPSLSDSSNQNPLTKASSAGTANKTPDPLPVAPAVQPKKKSKRQRPSTVTYVDGTHGVSFRYPRKFTLKAGEQAVAESNTSSLPMNFLEPGGVPVASVELPGSLYKGTDFVHGIFQVSVHKNLTGTQCEQFGSQGSVSASDTTGADFEPVGVKLPSEDGVLMPLKASFRGVSFSELEMATDLSLTRYYHRYEGGSCYEFALGLQTAPHESVDDMPPVDDRDVFARLEKILATVKFKSAVLPEVNTAAIGSAIGEGSNH